MATFPEIDYTSRDYQSFKSDLLNLMANHLPEWTNITESDFGVMLCEIFSHLADSLAYYQDRQANESFLPTATLRKNIINLCKLINYELRNASPAIVTVQFTCNAAGTIPARTQVATTSTDLTQQIIFETDEDIIVAAPGVVSVDCTQGVTYLDEIIGLSDGTINQIMALANSPYIADSLQVYIDEGAGYILWAQATNNDLLNHSGIERVYSVSVDENDILTVVFGDAINGKIPIVNSSVKVNYRVGGGLVGNVGAGTVVNLLNTLVFVDSITNASSSSGGEDKEGIEEARISAPSSIYTLNRGVTERDFVTLVTAYPGVAKSRCIGILDTPAKAWIWVLPTGGGIPTDALLAAITSYLSDRRLLGVEITCYPVIYAEIDIAGTIQVASNFKQSTVQSNVNTALDTYFEVSSAEGSRDFGQVVPLGDIYQVIEGVEGVSYCNLTKLFMHPIDTLVIPNFSFDSRVFLLGALPEDLTVTDLGAGSYSVVGTVSGAQSNGTFGAAYMMNAGSNRDVVGWTLNSTGHRAGDIWLVKITAAEMIFIKYTPFLTYTFSSYITAAGLVAETWTIIDTAAGTFSVTGNISGAQTGGTYGNPWLADTGANSGKFGFVLSPFNYATGDRWTLIHSAYVGNVTLGNMNFAQKGIVALSYFGGY